MDDMDGRKTTREEIGVTEFKLALGMSLHSVFSATYVHYSKDVFIGLNHSNRANKWAPGCVNLPERRARRRYSGTSHLNALLSLAHNQSPQE